MESDIVARLRRAEWYCHKSEEHMCYCNKKCSKRNLPDPDECREAADEIERLRELSGDAGQLRKERDEARREVCQLEQEIGYDRKQDIAKQRGWDCFKEATDGK